MKKEIYIIVYTIVIVVLVGAIVFLNSNQQTQYKTPSNNASSVTSKSNEVFPEELATHNKQSDCWVSYKSKVYDITSFLPKHPGSAEAIAPYCGTSTQFENAFTGQHGTSQVNTLMKEGVYKGELQ